MPKTPLFSTYRQGENRVAASLVAVFQRIDLDLVERLLASAIGESTLEMVHFRNQAAAAEGTVPDAEISANFHYLFELEIERGAVRIKQLRGHLEHLRASAASQRLFVVTPDDSEPAVIPKLGDQRVMWFSFIDLDQAIGELLADENEMLSQQEEFLLRELRRLLEEEGLLLQPEEVVIVAARNAYPEYFAHSAYVCQTGRFRAGLERIGFYTEKQIKPEVPLIRHRVDPVAFTTASAERYRESAEPFSDEIAELIDLRLESEWGYEGEELQVFLLTGPDDPDTIRLTQPIQHPGRVAWTMGHRYLRATVFDAAPVTTAQLG